MKKKRHVSDIPTEAQGECCLGSLLHVAPGIQKVCLENDRTSFLLHLASVGFACSTPGKSSKNIIPNLMVIYHGPK